jgi:hypothetical protein
MILIDYNQLAISNLMKQTSNSQNLEEGLVRHMVLNSIRAISKKFRNHGDIVIACDGPTYWRRDVYPQYKQHRKKDREKSGHDWTAIFTILHKIREEISQHMPYKVIRVEGAEADDIIAVLTKKYAPHENIMIVSSDKDFVQLHVNKSVKQWSPILGKFVTTDSPQRDKLEHILRGDKGDGIPNALSDDDSFVKGERQKTLNSKKLAEWLELSYDDLAQHSQLGHGFTRNRMLIDLENIPTNISQAITDQYESIAPKPRAAMINYFMASKLTNLISSIDEF